MKKQTRALVEIGLLYVAASILLDYFLGAYPILLWGALAVEFILFATMILGALWEDYTPITDKREKSGSQRQDALTRLEHLCEAAITQGDGRASGLLSERIRSLAFAAAANNLNTSETTLKATIDEEASVLQEKIGDSEVFNELTEIGSLIEKGDTKALESLLGKIEEWIT